MGKSYTPTTVGSGVQTTTTLGTNFANIETALQDCVSRSGLAPNAMAADFDMGANDIINVDNITVTTDITVGGVGIVAQVTAAAASAAAALASEVAALASEVAALASETAASASETLASQWASLTGALVAATDYSAKEYAIGSTVPEGSSKIWATTTGAALSGTEYSSKEYAIGTFVPAGSAKQWAIEAEDVLVDATDYSAFHWAQKAMAIVGGVQGKVSANDTTADYLGNKFTALHGLTWTEQNDGADEDLEISIGTHLEVGGGANNYNINVYQSDSATCRAQFSNLTTGNGLTDGFQVGITASEEGMLWNYENTPVLFAANNAEAMRVNASGNVNIGGVHDTNNLMVHQVDSAANVVHFTNITTGVTAADGFIVGLSATEQAQLWNFENTQMVLATNNLARLRLENDGGVFTNGATGGSQGVDTINVGGYYANGNPLLGGAMVSKGSGQTLTTSTWTPVSWDTEHFDDGTYHDTVTNNTRITVPTGATRIRLVAHIVFAPNATGIRQARFLKGGLTTIGGAAVTERDNAPDGTNTSELNITTVLDVAAGDYFEVDVYQSSGGNLDVYSGSGNSHFYMEVIK